MVVEWVVGSGLGGTGIGLTTGVGVLLVLARFSVAGGFGGGTTGSALEEEVVAVVVVVVDGVVVE